MPIKNTAYRYGAIAMSFHWTIAILILANFPLGIYFHFFVPRGTPEQMMLLQFHASIGIAVLILSVLRLGWRLVNPIPALTSELGAKKTIFALSTHYALYTLMILVPLVGWGIISLPEQTFVLFGIIPWPKIWILAALPLATKTGIAKWLFLGHSIGALLLILLALGHITAALGYHYLIRKDQILQRMLPGSRINANAT